MEPDRPNHNFAEGVIRELRKKWFGVMVKQNFPRCLWDDGMRWFFIFRIEHLIPRTNLVADVHLKKLQESLLTYRNT